LGAQFQEVFHAGLPTLFDHIMVNPALTAIPQHFLAIPAMSRTFAR
jgi:hypothetical protein